MIGDAPILLAKLGRQMGCIIRSHGLRHTAITTAIAIAAKGRRPLTTVQRFARHRSFNTTAGCVNAVACDVHKVMDLMPT